MWRAPRKKLGGPAVRTATIASTMILMTSPGQNRVTRACFSSWLKFTPIDRSIDRTRLAVRPPSTPPLLHRHPLPSFEQPKVYKVRLYVLQALNLTPMDMGIGGRPGKSDPYLRVRLGKEVRVCVCVFFFIFSAWIAPTG